MDAKDVRIFCEIGLGYSNYDVSARRQTHSPQIGRNLHLDEKTVRVRIRRMEDEGFIKYYQANPNLTLFGLTETSLYRFEALNIATKYNLVETVAKMPDVVEVFDYIGPFVGINTAGTSAVETQRFAEEIAQRFELSKQKLAASVLSSSRKSLDNLDWRIVQELRYDARRSNGEVAESLSISPRMAAYRIGRLLDSGALTVQAVINTQKQHGLVFYELEISVDEGKHNAAIQHLRDVYAEKFWLIRRFSEELLLASMFGFDLSEPEDAVMNVLKLKGIRRCTYFIWKEMIEPRRPNWVDALVQARVERPTPK